MSDKDLKILREWQAILPIKIFYDQIGRTDGITFHIYSGESTKHHRPHLHVKTSSAELSIAIDNGDIIKRSGKINPPEIKRALNWIVERKDFIQRNWDELVQGITI